MTRRHVYSAALATVMVAAAVGIAGCARGSRALSPRDEGMRTRRGRVVARIVAYNVQNLFDGTDHGGEYPEFRTSSGWDRGDYYERLERLSEAIRRTSRGPRDRAGHRTAGGLPDIVVLSEVESASVAADLARDFLRRYRWVSGAPEPGRRGGHPNPDSVGGDSPEAGPGAEAVISYPPTATRVAVLSRRRPELRSHRAAEIDLVPGARARVRWRSREAVELRFASRGLRLLAAHWKSQAGGERATEPRRILEAALVHDLLVATAALEADYPVTLLVGDLNEDLHEERQHGGAWPTALVPWRPRAVGEVDRAPARRTWTGGDAVPSEGAADTGRPPEPTARIRFVEGAPDPVHAAADDGPIFRTLYSGESSPGTYWYRGEWERLDHAFLLAPGEYGGRIDVGTWDALFEPDGTPARYDARRGRGYSDHLPILVTVTRRPGL